MCSILFIIQNYSFFGKMLNDEGLNTHRSYKGKDSIFMRCLREIHFRLNLPRKSIWFNPITVHVDVFFIYADLIIPEYIEWLHNNFPLAKFIMYYPNKVNNKSNPDMFRYYYLKLWTSDLPDSVNYNMNLVKDVGGYSRTWVVNKEKPQFDVFFVGKDKNHKRFDYLQQLEKQFAQLGLRTYFHIVSEHRYGRYFNSQYKGFMPYDECLKFLGKTKSILYLGYGSQECVTIRILESLVHNIKLITDCLWIKNYDFYNSHNIFILGEDDINGLPDFLNTPYVKVESSILAQLFYEDFLNYIVSNSYPSQSYFMKNE